MSESTEYNYIKTWSPFDPGWYKDAFDKFISTADELFYKSEIAKQGYDLPDADGSKSSVFHRDAVLNNSFNEKLLRETLKDIYLNSSHKLISSNHDEVHFFHKEGYFDSAVDEAGRQLSDVYLIPNSTYAEIRINTNQFISPDLRDKIKLSQYYRNWISITDIASDWSYFKFMVLLFINKRIYSEYELRIDDRLTTIRFKYEQFWVDRKYPVYVCKFDTNYQTRIKIAAETVANPDRWNWTVPMVEWYAEQKVLNFDKVAVTFNRIADPNERADGRTNVDAMGDNIEFVPVDKNGVIDLSEISSFNKELIVSEHREWIWMTVFVPKFLHEFPIPLATDVVYRPYYGKFSKVWAMYNGEYKVVRTENGEPKYVHISMDDKGYEYNDGWREVIRPVVLADAFDTQNQDPYAFIREDIQNISDRLTGVRNLEAEFKLFVDNYTTDVEFVEFCESTKTVETLLNEAYESFIDAHNVDEDNDYKTQLYELGLFINDMEPLGQSANFNELWNKLDTLHVYATKLVSRYMIMDDIDEIPEAVWEENLPNQLRFRRPIDPTDFWMFEYDFTDKVWRPTVLDITRHFPDAYTFGNPTEPEYTEAVEGYYHAGKFYLHYDYNASSYDDLVENPQVGVSYLDITTGTRYIWNDQTLRYNIQHAKVYKALFFYSDTMNVRKTTSDIVRATPGWDADMEEFMYDKGATYRDIFMEKFYWMGVRSIYKGMLATKYRWEAIEYIQDNDSYERFNELFMNTMDPYFKMGLATYLKSADYQFPFDYAISKMNEGIDQIFLDYQKVTNFEMYLNKTWQPSYFDYMVSIMDDFDFESHLVRRPGTTFDITRLFRLIQDKADLISGASDIILGMINASIDDIEQHGYLFDLASMIELKDKIILIGDNINDVVKTMDEFDRGVFSINDIEHISEMLQHHLELLVGTNDLFAHVHDDAANHISYYQRISEMDAMAESITKAETALQDVYNHPITFSIDQFMKDTNDPDFFDRLDHDGDNSLIGLINEFTYPWDQNIQDKRNALYESTVALWTYYGDFGTYKTEDIEKLLAGDVYEFIVNLEDLRLSPTTPLAYQLEIVDGNLILHYNDEDDELAEYIFDILNNKDLLLCISGIIPDRMENVLHDLVELQAAVYGFWGDPSNYDQTIVDAFNTAIQEITSGISETLHHYDAVATVLDGLYEINNHIYNINTVGASEMEIAFEQILEEQVDIIRHEIVIADPNEPPITDAFIEIHETKYDWDNYLEKEKGTFDNIADYTHPPVQYLVDVEVHSPEIEAIISCIAGYNTDFVPDTELPSYARVYRSLSISIVDGGFNHNVGDIVYIPDVGIYRINRIEGPLRTATELSLIANYNMFRDPKSSEKTYRGITNGLGIGIIIRVDDSTYEDIIDDSACDKYIAKAENIKHLIERDSATINPYNNTSMVATMDKIHDMDADWNELLSIYGDHISQTKQNGIDTLIDSLDVCIPLMDELVVNRNKIDLKSIMNLLNEYINAATNIFEEQGLVNPDFTYHTDILRALYNNLRGFYGNGTDWSDGEELTNILDDIQMELNDFVDIILDQYLPYGDGRTILDGMYNSIWNKIDESDEGITNSNDLISFVPDRLQEVQDVLDNMPESQIDEWYAITSSSTAIGGEGYNPSDIVSIPEFNDIHIIITDVDANGTVTRFRPLCDYALTERISGSSSCINSVGQGSGMIASINSKQVRKEDTTVFIDPTSDPLIPAQFDDNDLLSFRFENIHDLPIGYEVFYGGRQIPNFIQRHRLGKEVGSVADYDELFLNANDVMELQNSAVEIKTEHYFIYKLDGVEIVDGGTGYHVGQEIVVATEQVPLKLLVTKVGYPTGSIEAVAVVENNTTFSGADPAAEEAETIDDTIINIDDEFSEGYYDHLTQEGIVKPVSRELPVSDYYFVAKRFDDLEDGLRNKNYMYPTVDMPEDSEAKNGDPDEHFYLGSRIDNSQVPEVDEHIWDGIDPAVPHMDPFIPDSHRVPTNQPTKGEYQEIMRIRIHNDPPLPAEEGVKVVATYADLPKHIDDWPGICINMQAIVVHDETHGGHMMRYTVRSYVLTGYIVYNEPELNDMAWTQFIVSWIDDNYYPDLPTLKAQYPDADYTVETYADVQAQINEKKVQQKFYPKKKYGTYIHDVTINDISVYNYTFHRWEDLSSEHWTLQSNDAGFTLRYNEDGMVYYSYDMALFLNKTPDTQQRNAALKSKAKFNVSSYIYDEVDIMRKNIRVNTGRKLRVRKLFPYEQNESYTLSNDLGKEMRFSVNNYLHFRNELHLEDVAVYNKTAGRYEDIFDKNMFEVKFKDAKSISTGFETQTKITQAVITNPGEGFSDGYVWAINKELKIQLFGEITADYMGDGHMITFTPIHCPNPPKEDLLVEFQVYQYAIQWNTKVGQVIVEFKTERVEVSGDGYIHNVDTSMAPLSKEFVIECKYDLPTECEYEVRINKNPQMWEFVRDDWEIFPTFVLPGVHIPQDRLYIVTSKGRIPLINPSTGKPALIVKHTDNDTEVIYLNLYNKYEHIYIYAAPYPIRSVYIQRRVPKNGFVNLKGKINKPLNKKYFEFWMNGRLLSDEVTIISPTKLFFHGLKSLRNLEIIEVNRTTSEYFADDFIDLESPNFRRPYPIWKYDTFLDDALTGNLDGDNYTTDEQAALLQPVWPQVPTTDADYKNYPENVDSENDILLRVDDYADLSGIDYIPYQFSVINVPTIEGVPISGRSTNFADFGFVPLTNDDITMMLDEEWAEEIANGEIPPHTIISADEWIGVATRLYDKYGTLVHSLNDAAYRITDEDQVRINTENRISHLVKYPQVYDLS